MPHDIARDFTMLLIGACAGGIIVTLFVLIRRSTFNEGKTGWREPTEEEWRQRRREAEAATLVRREALE